MQGSGIVTALLVFLVLLQVGGCSEKMAEDGVATLQHRILSKRSGSSSRGKQCCSQETLNNLKESLEDDLELLTQTVFEIGFSLQEFIHLGQNSKYPAYSCHQIFGSKPASPSGYYWLRGPKGYDTAYAARMYCNMQMDIPIFGTTQGWMQVANLDMNDPHQQCPRGFKLITHPVRLCVKSAKRGCSSILFPTHFIQYKRVCGRVVGYQVGSNNAFH